jgi:hypothetical protein
MGARIAIVAASVLFFIPGCILAFLSPTNGRPEYISFIALIPFLGTYPLPMWQSDGRETYEHAWAIAAGLATLGFAIFGVVSGRAKHALFFVVTLVLIWAVALVRFVGMNEF